MINDPITHLESDNYGRFTDYSDLAKLYSQAGILYVALNAELEIIIFNSAAEEALEVDREDILGKKFLSLAKETVKDDLDKALKTCSNKGFLQEFETCLESKSGRNVWVRINGKVETQLSHEDSYIQLFMHDITDSVRQKRQRYLLNKLLEFQYTGKKEGLALTTVMNALKNLMECEIAAVSCLPLRMSEKDKKEKYQTIFSDWNHEQWRLLYKETLEDEECKKTRRGGIWCEDLSESTLLLAHDTLERQDLLRYKSLALVPFNLGSSEFSFIYLLDTRPGLFDDNEVNYLESIALILQKAHSLETPKKSKTNPEIENTSYAPLMGIMTTKENQVVDVNDWLLNFTGYSEEELQGRDFLTLIAVEYHETIQALLNQSDLVGEPLDSQEIEIIARDGRRRAVECAWQFYAMNGDSLDVWYFVSKEDKQWLQMQLLKSRKMESLGMLAGGIVHDFNNLLASILGYASLIQEEITKDSSYYEDVLQIQKTSEQGTELTSRLMAYTQGKEYIVNNLNINKLVTEVAGILSRTLDKKIIIRAELDDNLHLIYGDANQIQQSILQVALNARDAMPFGGKITFKTRNISVRESSVWTNQGAEPGEYVQVIISDSGKGIGSEIKDRIFEPHFTTKENETGRGLGLSMVKEIVDKHGGFISIFSEKNKGTMCKIQLRANIKPQQNKKKSPVTKPKLGKETILLIDEEKVLRDTARMMLTRYGYKVISTDTDKEAMSILQKYPSRIDLIIIDLLLKNINIKQTVDSFKKINPKIRVIASTSDVGTETMEGPVKESLAAVVNKPYQLRPLLSTIRSVLNA